MSFAIKDWSRSMDTLSVVAPKLASALSLVLLNLYAIQWLEPASYGAFGLCLTFLVLFETIAGAALDIGVLREAPLLREPGVLGMSAPERSAVVLKLGMSAIMLCLAVLFGDAIAGLFFQQSDAGGIPIAVVFAGAGILLARSVQVSFQVSRRFYLFGAADLTHTLLRMLFVCGAIAAGYTSVAFLLIAYGAAAFLAGCSFGAVLFKKALHQSWFDRAEIEKLGRYSGGVLAVGGISTLLASVDVFLLAVLGTPSELGLYRAALTLALLPELAGSCLSQFFGPYVAVYCRDRIFYRLFLNVQGGLLAASILLLLAGVQFIRPMLELLFPEKYAASIDVIVLLLPAGLAGFVLFPLIVNFLAFYSLRSILIVDVALAPLLIAGCWYAATHGGLSQVAIVVSAVRVTKAIVLFLISARLARRMDAHQPGQPDEEVRVLAVASSEPA
ncbi:MAG: lipopolysaccharide biosynthesis protein [Bryobacteraceae bacterium]